MMTRNKYDALGRMRNHGSPQRMAYFNKKIPYKEEKGSRSDLLVSGIIVASSDTLCNRLSSGEWVCGEKNYLARRLNDASEFNDKKKCNIKLKKNYGIVENGNLVGGMTCAWPNVKISINSDYHPIDESDKYAKIVVNYTVTSETTLGDNDHLTVKEGYVFPNGHVTTSEEENQFDKHEEGHEFYNNCVIFEEINMTNQFECTVKLKKGWTKTEKDKAVKKAVEKKLAGIDTQQSLTEKLNEGQKKLDAMASRFHKDHGIGGYSDVYTCPTD